MPDTKPDLFFDKTGVCDACRSFERRKDIDWKKRKSELLQILKKYKNKNGTNWDCIVPVSGGKDSHFQVLKMLELGLNPLCVTATTCNLTEIGKQNIENLKKLGADYLEFTTNRQVRAKLNRICLTQIGDISWPEHVSIFTIPVRVSVQYKIPLLIWGENSQDEFGGPAAAKKNNVLNRRWLEEFGGLLGLRVTDLIGTEGIAAKDMLPFVYPEDKELRKVGTTGIFLGHYLPWDGLSNTIIAKANGFSSWGSVVMGAMVDYENLDNYQSYIHDYFKFLKFGFGRATDQACLHIRRGRLTREEAIKIVRKHDGQFPSSYLDLPLEKILEPLDLSVEEFVKICDRFTNKKIFLTDSRGNLVKDRNGNLTKKEYPV